jgi:hypothetical protein
MVKLVTENGSVRRVRALPEFGFVKRDNVHPLYKVGSTHYIYRCYVISAHMVSFASCGV